ncbi:leucine-rich repeats and immunoglobulin-like domains protein sma-10 [Anthonomus grandis grandis]|uniref:leucine-rich repeats and immunoglobulin-like domains protein sma-10 n=1 Tax=Anthonomus grandis grandis TaxID=2921223 RepID=UPI002165DA45|nr:leucine-rich repeats and immunoglobulin-like domains protein sma-10 [Anthonomus grandis grandis]
MLKLVLFVITALHLTHGEHHQHGGDYEIWLDRNNVTSNIFESGSPNNESLICKAEILRIHKKCEVLKLDDLECASGLVSLIAEDIDLREATLKELPPSVQNVTIVRNNLQQLKVNAFSNLTVQLLNLTGNKIESIHPSAFDYMRNLTQLILDHNELTTFNFTFLDCPKLKLLSLRFNFIKSLGEGALKPLKLNVLTVLLSYNNIREIHKTAMDVKQFHEVKIDHNELSDAQLLIKLTKADLVDLSDNKITCLPKEFMENGLSKIKVLNLTGNPLECHCLNDLKKKVKKNIEFQKMSPLVQNINIVLPKHDTKTC